MLIKNYVLNEDRNKLSSIFNTMIMNISQQQNLVYFSLKFNKKILPEIHLTLNWKNAQFILDLIQIFQSGIKEF